MFGGRAEIRGIIDGMTIAWNQGIRKLRIQSDSSTAVNLLADAFGSSHQHFSLVRSFQELKNRKWEVSIEHIYREANNAADFIANSGHSLELGTTVFTSPCNTLLDWLCYDLIGVSLPREIYNTL
ncbi:Putative ribonuclease H protein At1g65750 [Linum perenne]